MVMGSLTQETELAIIGSGPGGYVAAIRAADLGREVVLIEQREQPGGVCLLEGCIPSKALINAVEVAQAATDAKRFGITFQDPSIDLEQLRAFTRKTIAGLTGGIGALLKRRGVELIHGRARFSGPNELHIEGGDVAGVRFKNAIVATGSRPTPLGLAEGLPVWTSTEALTLPEIPPRLIVIGGGYIGVELGLVYAGLGAQVSLVEFAPRLLPGADEDLVEVMVRVAKRRLADVRIDSKVVALEQTGAGFAVTVEHEGKRQTLEAERVLTAVGRTPNTDDLGLEKIGLSTRPNGQLEVDEAGRTELPGIWAIGDVTPGPMLAHKASREAKVVAEAISGHVSAFDNRSIPAVVFTDPEIAWAGLTEREAAHRKIPVKVGRFPLRALGRARTLGRTDGLVKVLADPETELVLGVGMVGPNVSELIAEGSLALEMGATLEDLMVTIHPHPTLSEAIMEAAEVAADHPVHILPS
jgi:dihydrolipoamide dehydrogenase